MQAHLVLNHLLEMSLHDGSHEAGGTHLQPGRSANTFTFHFFPAPAQVSYIARTVLTFHVCLKLGNFRKRIQTDTGNISTLMGGGQGEVAIDRKQEEKLYPPWRQRKSLPGIRFQYKVLVKYFGRADRPHQLFLDYRL